MSAKVKRRRMHWAMSFCVAIFAVTGAVAQPQPGGPSGAPQGPGSRPFDYVITDSEKNLPDLFGWDKNRVATIGERTNPRTTPPDIGPGTGEPIDKFTKCVEAYMALGLSREVAQAKCKG